MSTPAKPVSWWRSCAIAWHASNPTPEEHLNIELADAELQRLLHAKELERHQAHVDMYNGRIQRLKSELAMLVPTSVSEQEQA